jgi:hypothetical protein
MISHVLQVTRLLELGYRATFNKLNKFIIDPNQNFPLGHICMYIFVYLNNRSTSCLGTRLTLFAILIIQNFDCMCIQMMPNQRRNNLLLNHS